ncbi:hypothetical protein [Pseudonocardia sp.]
MSDPTPVPTFGPVSQSTQKDRRIVVADDVGQRIQMSLAQLDGLVAS